MTICLNEEQANESVVTILNAMQDLMRDVSICPASRVRAAGVMYSILKDSMTFDADEEEEDNPPTLHDSL